MMSSFLFFVLACATGYVLGSIPFGLLIAKGMSLGDVRQIGSGNIGATNVLRTGNKMAAILTLLSDALKGWMGLWLGMKVLGHQSHALAPGSWEHALFYLSPVVGHIFPVWLHFKGGKGVATALGILIFYHPLLALITFAVWGATVGLTRVSSLGALTSICAAALGGVLLNDGSSLVLLGPLALLIFWTHRDNIHRLLTGKESRFGP
jgi:glycerol-3-phosphate acyltransferase PlsY